MALLAETVKTGDKIVTTFSFYANESQDDQAEFSISTMTEVTHQVDHVLAVLAMM